MSASIFSTYGAILAVGMIVTGSLNTISTKAADLQYSLNRYNEMALFSHPFVQAWGMFSGEFLCLIVYTFLSMRATSKGDDSFPRAKPHSKFIYLVPALCDMMGTSIMYLGLSLTSSSVFQMLRGSVVIFTAVFSVVFLKRTVKPYQWLGVCLVLVGTIAVGLQSYVCKSDDGASSTTDTRAMTGNILIILAQIIVATQMVVEEKFLSAYDVPPLQVVGWEGLWGLTILSGVLGIMYVVPTTGTPLCSPNLGVYANGTAFEFKDGVCDHVEDTYDALVQFNNNKLIILFTVLNLFSIAFFNFFGVSVTKFVNASTRVVLDSLRTMVIWGFSMAIGWEKFCYVQIIGFMVLLAGTFVFNGILKVPGFSYEEEPKGEEEDELLEFQAASGEYDELDSSSLNVAEAPTYKIKGFNKR